jgi:soluble lytic murein transglycosylase
MPTFARLTQAVFVAALAALGTALPALAQSDADFIAARMAFDKGDRVKLAAVAGTLSGHVLAPYVAYWQLKLGLEDASPQAIWSYLDRYPNTPLADKLRTDWLKLLGRKGLWARFAQDYAPSANDDAELACYNVLYQWQRDGESALANAIPLWFTGAATPDACDPAFAALIKRGDITPADRRARFRMANEAGNLKVAQAIGADLPGKDRIADREYADVSRDPLRALEKGAFAWTTGSGQELALFALERAARSDAGAARSAWVKWRDRLSEGDRRYGNARLAYYAARQLHPNANEWFREAGDMPLAPELAAWRARAALRALRFDDALAAIEAMSETQRQEAAWRYWRARALAARGRQSEATAVLRALVSGPRRWASASWCPPAIRCRLRPPRSPPSRTARQ